MGYPFFFAGFLLGSAFSEDISNLVQSVVPSLPLQIIPRSLRLDLKYGYKAILALVQELGWNQVQVIGEESDAMRHFRKMAAQHDVCIVREIILPIRSVSSLCI